MPEWPNERAAPPCVRELSRFDAVGRLEDHLHRLLACELVEVAVDDVGHQAVGIDRALARCLDPFGLVAEAERTDRARISGGAGRSSRTRASIPTFRR